MSLDIYFYEYKKCPHCGGDIEGEEVHWQNITHNLNTMAEAAGFYKHLWRPEEVGIKKAGELIAPIEVGLNAMRYNPEKYKALSASNGWGTYDQFIPWLEKLILKCREYPDAIISVNR